MSLTRGPCPPISRPPILYQLVTLRQLVANVNAIVASSTNAPNHLPTLFPLTKPLSRTVFAGLWYIPSKPPLPVIPSVKPPLPVIPPRLLSCPYKSDKRRTLPPQAPPFSFTASRSEARNLKTKANAKPIHPSFSPPMIRRYTASSFAHMTQTASSLSGDCRRHVPSPIGCPKS